MDVATKLTLTCHRCNCVHEFDATDGDSLKAVRTERRKIGWHKTHVNGEMRYACAKCWNVIVQEKQQASYASNYKPRPLSIPSKVNLPEAIQLWHEGWTLETLSKRYGVTRERVRQKLCGHVDRTRQRPALCQKCGKSFNVEATSGGNAKYCSGECRAAVDFVKNHDQCECGATKAKLSTHCIKCWGAHSYKYDPALAVRLYQAGVGSPQLGELFGVYRITVYMMIRRRGIKTRPRGTRNSLTMTQVCELAEKFKEEMAMAS